MSVYITYIDYIATSVVIIIVCNTDTFTGRTHAYGDDKDLPTTSQRELERCEQPEQPGGGDGSGAVDVAGQQKN